MKIRVTESAKFDLARGCDFYSLSGDDVGLYFLDSLSADIDSLALYAGIHARHLGYHRMLATRFPYAIYYKMVKGEVQVWRVLDCRENPTKTRRALQQSGALDKPET